MRGNSHAHAVTKGAVRVTFTRTGPLGLVLADDSAGNIVLVSSMPGSQAAAMELLVPGLVLSRVGGQTVKGRPTEVAMGYIRAKGERPLALTFSPARERSHEAGKRPHPQHPLPIMWPGCCASRAGLPIRWGGHDVHYPGVRGAFARGSRMLIWKRRVFHHWCKRAVLERAVGIFRQSVGNRVLRYALDAWVAASLWDASRCTPAGDISQPSIRKTVRAGDNIGGTGGIGETSAARAGQSAIVDSNSDACESLSNLVVAGAAIDSARPAVAAPTPVQKKGTGWTDKRNQKKTGGNSIGGTESCVQWLGKCCAAPS